MTRVLLLVACSFVALTAIGGGIALVSGLEASRYSNELLRGTPFADYVVPGLILALAVGGSAAIAVVFAMLRQGASGAAAIAAGVILIGWIFGEFMLLPISAHSWVESAYFAIGCLIVVLGVTELGGQVSRLRPR